MHPPRCRSGWQGRSVESWYSFPQPTHFSPCKYLFSYNTRPKNGHVFCFRVTRQVGWEKWGTSLKSHTVLNKTHSIWSPACYDWNDLHEEVKMRCPLSPKCSEICWWEETPEPNSQGACCQKLEGCRTTNDADGVPKYLRKESGLSAAKSRHPYVCHHVSNL